MTSTRRRQRLLLGVLIVAGGVAFLMWTFGGPSAGTPGAASSPAGRGAQGARGDAPVTDVKLELLQGERGPLRGPDRNPFRFERREVAGASTRARQPVRQVVPSQPEGPQPPPPPPPIPLRFIGFLQPTGGAARVAVLSDGRGNVFDSREGDVIEGRYRLLRVGNDSADLIYLDGRGRQTIRLSGQ